MPGRRLKQVVSTRAIVHALKAQDREPLQLPFEEIQPEVTAAMFDSAIVIRRGSNQLLLYHIADKPKLLRSFKVATGRSQYPDPARHSSRSSPSSWIRGGTRRPGRRGRRMRSRSRPGPATRSERAGWGSRPPYVGIHGTPDAASIGYSASHGCIRMLIPQVEWLFTKVDVGTPVFIVAA